MTSSPSPNFLQQLDAAYADVLALLTMPPKQLTRPPAPGHWSALQCVEHIVLTNQAYFPGITRATEEALARGDVARGPYHYSLMAKLLVWAVEPPSRVKVPVPSPKVVPEQTLTVDQVRRAYIDEYTAFRACIAKAVMIDLRKTEMHSPFFHRLSFSVGTALGVLLGHERRHIHQARRAALMNGKGEVSR